MHVFNFLVSQHNHLFYLQIYKDLHFKSLRYQRGIFKSHNKYRTCFVKNLQYTVHSSQGKKEFNASYT